MPGFEGLPPEIQNAVFFHLDPASFFAITKVSRHLRDVASTSRAVLLHNLIKIPGFCYEVGGLAGRLRSSLSQFSVICEDRGIDRLSASTREYIKNISTAALFLRFCKWATRSLFGAEQNADLVRFTTTDESDIRTAFLRSFPREGDDILVVRPKSYFSIVNRPQSSRLIVIRRSEARLQVYRLTEGVPQLEIDLIPHLPDSGEKREYEFKVLQVAFTGDSPSSTTHPERISVLLQYKPLVENGSCSAFIQEAIDRSSKLLKLLTYTTESDQSPSRPSRRLVLGNTRDISIPNGQYPVGLAMATDLTAAVSWKREKDGQVGILVYGWNGRAYDPSPEMITPGPVLTNGVRRIFLDEKITMAMAPSLGFVTKNEEEKLHFFQSGVPDVARFFQSDYTPSVDGQDGCDGDLSQRKFTQDIHVNASYLTTTSFDISKESSAAIGAVAFSDPLASISMTFPLAADSMENIRTSSLFLGLPWNPQGPSIACLVREVQDTHGPDPYWFQTGEVSESWHVVMVLIGFPRSWSSIGQIIATSPKLTRIAVANWRSVLVWTLEPHIFLGGRTVWERKESLPWKRHQIVHPMTFASEGVIHSLSFSTDDVIWAVTDRGLFQWNMGPSSAGRRETWEY